MASLGNVDAMTFLDQWVIQDGKPITARLLSTLLKIHINIAHKKMSQFFESASNMGEEAIPFTSWVLKGQLKAELAIVSASQLSSDSMEVDEDGSRSTAIKQSLLLVTQDKLEEIESTFERIDVKEVYSFSPRLPANYTKAHKVAAISQLATIQHDLHSNKSYVDTWESTERGVQLGTIQAAEKWKDAGKAIFPESKAGPSKFIVKKEQPIEIKREEKKIDTKPFEKKGGLNWGKAKSVVEKPKPKQKRKLIDSDEEEGDESVHEAALDEDEEDDAGPIGYADEGVSMEDGRASKKRADAGDKVSAEEEKRRKRKQELMDMMEEDGEADPPQVKTSTSTTTSMMKGTEDHDEEAEQGKEEQAGPVVKGPKKRVRKQRKVITKQTTKDSKGYRKTIDVEGYESYSSDESDAAPTPAPRPAAASAAPVPKKEPQAGQANKSVSSKKTSGAGGGQKKLSSFFTKG